MKKKVLFFCDELNGGGAERVLLTILNNMDLNIFDVKVMSLNKIILPPDYPQEIIYKPVFSDNKFIRSIQYKIYQYLSPTIFYRLFVRGCYDVEVAFIEGYATRIISGSTNKKSKKIAWVHIDLVNNHWTKIAYKSNEEERKCYLRFDYVVSVSNAVKDAVDFLFPHVKSSIVLHNPIDSKKIRRKSLEQ